MPFKGCVPPTGGFYARPALPPGAQRGQLLRCEDLGVQRSALISIDARYTAATSSPANDLRLLRIMYVSQSGGALKATTALVYVPQKSGACVANAPVAAVAHGTMGMAPHCGPSKFPNFGLHHLAWPLAGQGNIVVAPDYIGLGTAAQGGHPYLIPEPTAHAVLDSIRAIEGLAEQGPLKGCVKRRVALLGHSQGGQAALVAARSLASTLTGWQHAATVAIAPAFGDDRVWLGPFQASLQSGVPTAYYLAFLLSAARYYGGPALNTWLTPKAQAQIPGLLDSFCFTEWTQMLLHHFPTFADIFQPAFLSASQACKAGAGDCQAFKPWVDAVKRSTIQTHSTQVPTLLVQGGKDLVVGAASVGCIASRFKAASMPVTSCYAPTADHLTVIGLSWKAILPWIQAHLQGKTPTPPSCPSSALPACP